MNRWSGVSEAYRRSFATLCAGTVEELLAILPPGQLLDVGCGTGYLLETAEAKGWHGIGVDADADMVALSDRVAPGRTLQAALPHLPFSDAEFDAVTANFVLNHVSDPRASLAEIARVSRPGAMLAATIWPAGGAGWNPLMSSVFASSGASSLPPAHLPPEADFQRTTTGLAGIVQDAGLRVRDAREVTWIWRIASDDLWAGISGGVATVGQTYLAQPSDVRRRIEQAFCAQARAIASSDGILSFENRAVLVLAQR